MANSTSPFSQVSTPDGCSLRKKEQYEYTTPNNVYNVELFENSDGTYYAIGVPRDSERLIVYGSNISPSAEQALQVLVDKILRDGAMIGEETETEETQEAEEIEGE
jgi:hypothetical protein